MKSENAKMRHYGKVISSCFLIFEFRMRKKRKYDRYDETNNMSSYRMLFVVFSADIRHIVFSPIKYENAKTQRLDKIGLSFVLLCFRIFVLGENTTLRISAAIDNL